MPSPPRLSVPLALTLALGSAACCKRPEPPSPDPSVQNAPAGQPATQSKTRPLSQGEIDGMKKQIAAGHTIHPQHSFGVNLKGFAGSMLATTGPEGDTFVYHFFDAGGRRVTSVFDKDMDQMPGEKILAVAFEDTDRDGLEDLVALAQYNSAKGAYNRAAVFTRSGGGPFRFVPGVGERAGNPATMAAALGKIR